MKLKDRYLVVVAIISGKNFPNRINYNVIAEAKFDGEVLCTDPVQHGESPLFEQELAWEMDKKSLHQHRLQRSSLKIQFFALSDLSPVKEFVGYVMLDLRSASSNKIHKFYPLLHTKYNKSRPEVCCCVYLDGDGQQVVHDDFPFQLDPSHIKPKLIHQSPHEPIYYQIGPEKLCKDGFLLSVTLVQAQNLVQLIPTDIHLPSTGDNSFYFHYALLGNDIRSAKFTDLVNTTFPSDKVSVNILSTLDILKMFFNHLDTIKIHLYCNQNSLGVAAIPISDLLKNVDHSFQQPAVLDGFYNISKGGFDRTGGKLTALDDKELPMVRVSVNLHRVNRFGQLDDGDGNQQKQQYQQEKKTVQINPSVEKDVKRNNSPVRKDIDIFHESSVDQTTSESLHHLCYTIELRSIRNMIRADHTKRIYTRYVYPLFGSAAPIMTHPPVEIRRDQDVLLPQGYCAFEFGTSWRNLETKLLNNPLIVEVFERDKTRDVDNCFGIVKIPLNTVLTSSGRKSFRKGHTCLSYNGVGNIVSVSDDEDSNKSVGELVYHITLEDFGPIKNQLGTKKYHKTKSETEKNVTEDSRSTLQYKVALELELWKEAEEASFLSQLKEKEKQTMHSLAEEWRKRDREREILVKKKITEYEELEKALRTTIVNLAQRERQLVSGETELMRLKKDLESEVERRTSELRDASRRMEQDCQHQNVMLTSQVDHWKTMARDWQEKYHHLDKEFIQYRSRQTNTPETKLQYEINQMQSDKLKLEEALESALKAKGNYKKQWVRALNEVARLKQTIEQLSKDMIRRQENELEQLKLKYKAMGEMNSGSSELGAIRQELEKLRELQIDSKSVGESDRPQLDADLDDQTTEQVMRLIEERDILLRTGLYTSQDQVISELDREIRRLMGNSGSK